MPKGIILYYLVLVLGIVAWRSQEAPSLFLRLAYNVAFFGPFLISKSWRFYPPLVLLFFTLTTYGFAYSFLSYSYPIYLLVGIILLYRGKSKLYPPNKSVLVFMFHVFLVDLFMDLSVYDTSICLLFLVLFPSFLPPIDSKGIKNFSFSFMLITLILASLVLYVGTEYSTLTTAVEGRRVDRAGWMDPNYFGEVVAMGAVVAFIVVMNWGKHNMITKVIAVAALLAGIFSLVQLASRGAVLFFISGSFCYFMLSKAKVIYKILVSLAVAGLVVYILQSGIADFLMYRIETDTGTGTGRTEIWQKKINAFFNEGSIINFLIGFGTKAGNRLGFDYVRFFHNDFVAVLVNYGFIGFGMFLYVLLKPFKLARGEGRKEVLALTMALVAGSMTLEPLRLGYLQWWCFYYYIYCVALNSKKIANQNG